MVYEIPHAAWYRRETRGCDFAFVEEVEAFDLGEDVGGAEVSVVDADGVEEFHGADDAAAEATATKVTKAAAEYFILTVVLGLVFGWGLKNEGDSRDSIVMQSERDGERKKKTRKRPDG